MFQQTIKNFNINFDVLNANNSFSSGDLITGHISFDLTKETKITSIAMALTGRANVHWSTGGGGRKRRSRRQFTAKLDFFNFKSVIVQENSATGGTSTLQPGRHLYPFTCQLPLGCVSDLSIWDFVIFVFLVSVTETLWRKHGTLDTDMLMMASHHHKPSPLCRSNPRCFPSTFRGVFGQILYSLTVDINRPWHMAKSFVTELNFVNRINTNQPELHAPLSGTNSMTLCCLWCASGPITMTVSVEKKAFMPGETVKIICQFSNTSSRTATPKVALQQKQMFYTINKTNKRKVMKNLALVTGEPVSAHTSVARTAIMLPIPTFAPLTISNCSIIEVDYVIEVNLSVTASPDLTVLVPIVLCDTPVNV